MANKRTVEDKLREEYFEVLPEIRRTLVETEIRVRRELLEVSLTLQRYERLLVTSRIKECDSAIDAPRRRRQPLGLFDESRAEPYSLTSLRDLAAVRVMAFPQKRLLEARDALRTIIAGWTSDPVVGIEHSDPPLAYKYSGTWSGSRITAEVQVVPLLIGLFWEVEHSAIYKPNPNLRGVARSEGVIRRRNEVFAALRAFEEEFEAAIAHAAHIREHKADGSPSSG